jgi:hypothetical protein
LESLDLSRAGANNAGKRRREPREEEMRAFLIACLAIIVLAGGAFYALGAVQRTSGVAYTTDGARISPKWSWRQMISRAKGMPKTATASMVMPVADEDLAEDCGTSTAWSMILADFVGTPTADPACQTSSDDE